LRYPNDYPPITPKSFVKDILNAVVKTF